MKKILSIFLSLVAVLTLSSCLKDKGFENQEYGIKEGGILDEPFVQILGGGLEKFDFALVKPDATDPLNTADTLSFKVFYVNNGKPADKDVKITLAVNPSAIASYNAVSGNRQYTALPDSTFMFSKKTVTVKAGQSFSEDVIIIYNPQKINPSVNYMIPISIVDAQGIKISSNNSTIYYHIILTPSNLLKGDYSVVGTRYNYTGSVSFNGNPANIPTPTGTVVIPSPKTAVAIDGDRVSIDFSNLGGAPFNFKYVITQLNNFSNINVDYNTDFKDGNSSIKTYLISYVSPIGQKAKFRIITHYNNNPAGGGNDRIIDEFFTQQ